MGRSESRLERMEHREDLPELIGRLAGDIASFVEAKLGLYRLEIEDSIRAHTRRALLYVAVGCIALTALLVLSLSLAFALSALLQSRVLNPDARHALAFAIVALLEVGAGALLARVARAVRSSVDRAGA